MRGDALVSGTANEEKKCCIRNIRVGIFVLRLHNVEALTVHTVALQSLRGL